MRGCAFLVGRRVHTLLVKKHSLQDEESHKRSYQLGAAICANEDKGIFPPGSPIGLSSEQPMMLHVLDFI